MTSAPVRDAVYGIGAISGTNTAKAERIQSKEQDFSAVMSRVKDNAKQTVYQSDNQLTEKNTASQSKETYEAKNDFKPDKSTAKTESDSSKVVDNTSKKTQDLSKEEPVDKEVAEAVEETAEEVMQEVEEALEVSEEELLAVMEQLGLQPIDLLNPDNMAAILTELAGEDSTIQLVMDEEMYLTLQDLTQMIEEKAQELLNATGLTDEELDVVMDQLKFLIDQKLSEENGIQDAELLTMEQPELLAETGEAMEDGEVPVIVKENTGADEVPNTELTGEAAEGIKGNTEAGKNEDSLFGQQQQNMPSFQNMSEEIAELAQESKLQGADTPNTESILKQLADYVKIQNGKELTEMELQLHPASLGNVKVLLSTKGGVVTAQLTTENEVVKNAIESQASQLKLNLEEQGVKVEAIEVSVASHQMERNLEQNTGDGHNQEQTEETNTHKIRKTSINLNSYDSEDELIEDITGADDATKIAMEMMAIGGNRMDLLA